MNALKALALTGLLAGAAYTVPQVVGPQGALTSASQFASSLQGSSRTASSVEPFVPCTMARPAPAPTGTFDGSQLPTVTADLRIAPQTSLNFQEVNLVTGFTYAYGIEVADYDCDGGWDTSLFNSYALAPRVPGAIGYISFDRQTMTQITEPDTWPELVQTGAFLFERQIAFDINEDGYLDIVGAGNSNEAVIAYINPGANAATTRWSRRYLSTSTPGTINLEAHDMDSDGRKDLVVALRINSSGIATGARGGLAWLKNPGPGSTGTWLKRTISPSSDLMDPRNLQVLDLDGNGKLDVYVSDSSTGIASTYLQSGNNQWERRRLNTGAIHGHYGASVVETGNPVPAIVQPVYYGMALLRFDRQAGQFTSQRLASFVFEDRLILVGDVVMSDIDGDGFTDLIFSVMSLSSSRTDPRRGGIYMMRKANNWAIETVAHRQASIVGLKVQDMDRDGLSDIIANAEYPENGVSIYFQRPAGQAAQSR